MSAKFIYTIICLKLILALHGYQSNVFQNDRSEKRSQEIIGSASMIAWLLDRIEGNKDERKKNSVRHETYINVVETTTTITFQCCC